jgi:hypothetical protein
MLFGSCQWILSPRVYFFGGYAEKRVPIKGQVKKNQLCQDFRGVIIEGIKEIPMPRRAKPGQKWYFHK